MNKHRRAFVSYAEADRAFASDIAKALDKAGVEVSIDADVKMGSTQFDWVRKQLLAADLVVLVVPLREGKGARHLPKSALQGRLTSASSPFFPIGHDLRTALLLAS